jgi:hypothetical protein
VSVTPSQIVLRPHVPPAYLRSPPCIRNVSFFGFFRSILSTLPFSLPPSSPGPCALPEPSATPIPFQRFLPSICSYIPFPNQDPPLPSSTPEVYLRYSFPFHSTPIHARAQHPSLPLLDSLPGTLSPTPSMTYRSSISLLTSSPLSFILRRFPHP